MTDCQVCQRNSDILIEDAQTHLKACPNCANILHITIPDDVKYDSVLHCENFHLYIKDGVFISGWYTKQNIITIPTSALRPKDGETLTQILIRLKDTYKKDQVYCGGCGYPIHKSWINEWTATLPYCRSCKPSLATFGVSASDGL